MTFGCKAPSSGAHKGAVRCHCYISSSGLVGLPTRLTSSQSRHRASTRALRSARLRLHLGTRTVAAFHKYHGRPAPERLQPIGGTTGLIQLAATSPGGTRLNVLVGNDPVGWLGCRWQERAGSWQERHLDPMKIQPFLQARTPNFVRTSRPRCRIALSRGHRSRRPSRHSFSWSCSTAC